MFPRPPQRIADFQSAGRSAKGGGRFRGARGRIEFCDTADWKSALRARQMLTPNTCLRSATAEPPRPDGILPSAWRSRVAYARRRCWANSFLRASSAQRLQQSLRSPIIPFHAMRFTARADQQDIIANLPRTPISLPPYAPHAECDVLCTVEHAGDIACGCARAARR